MRSVTSGGGWKAVRYTLRTANRVGWLALWRAMRSKNACKTCALGMGGQLGGMVNEAGHFPEVCKKSLQAMVADMQGGITPEFFARYSIAQLQALSPRELEACGRLVEPVYAGPGETHYRVVTWDEALDRIAAKLKTSGPARSFWYFSGRSSNEAGFLLQLFAGLYGTNNVNNCCYYCHQASGVGLADVIGHRHGDGRARRLEHADLVSSSAATRPNHPRLMRTLMHGPPPRRPGDRHQPGRRNWAWSTSACRATCAACCSARRSPACTCSRTSAATWRCSPASPSAIVERGAHDRRVPRRSTAKAWPSFAQRRRSRRRGTRSSRKSGVSRDEIDADRRAATARRRTSSSAGRWASRITLHGVENVQAIANLALLRGMVGRPNAGLLPIRGHSQRAGHRLGGRHAEAQGRGLRATRAAHFGVQLPTTPGLDTMACMEAAGRGELKVGVLPRRQPVRHQSRRDVRRAARSASSTCSSI